MTSPGAEFAHDLESVFGPWADLPTSFRRETTFTGTVWHNSAEVWPCPSRPYGPLPHGNLSSVIEGVKGDTSTRFCTRCSWGGVEISRYGGSVLCEVDVVAHLVRRVSEARRAHEPDLTLAEVEEVWERSRDLLVLDPYAYARTCEALVEHLKRFSAEFPSLVAKAKRQAELRDGAENVAAPPTDEALTDEALTDEALTDEALTDEAVVVVRTGSIRELVDASTFLILVAHATKIEGAELAVLSKDHYRFLLRRAGFLGRMHDDMVELERRPSPEELEALAVLESDSEPMRLARSMAVAQAL